MAVELHIPPPGRLPPGEPPGRLARLRSGLLAPRTRPAGAAAASPGILVPLLAAGAFALIALLLVAEQDRLRWTFRAAIVLAATALGFGVSRWFDPAFMARRAAILGALAGASVGVAKLFAFELNVPGFGHLRLSPSLGWPEAAIGVVALLILFGMALLERRD